LPAFSQIYSVVEIPGPPGYEHTVPTDINNHGQVVGYMFGHSGLGSTFIWDVQDGLRELPFFAGSAALRIDDAGVIYGALWVGNDLHPAKLLGGVVQELPLPAARLSFILQVTDNGIVLVGQDAPRRTLAVVGHTVYDLTALLRGASIGGINEQGSIGGCLGNLPYLRMLDGGVRQPPWGAARCVEVIGPTGYFSTGHAGDGRPGYYGTPDGRMFSLPDVPFYAVEDLNSSGTLVASVYVEQGAFVFREGVVTLLNDVIVGSSWRPVRAYGINDAGYVVADGRTHGAVLVPSGLPAPGGVTLAVSGNLVTLRWEPVAGTLDYLVGAGSAPGTRDLYNASVGNTTSLVATVPSGRYYVRLRARSAAAVSAPSAEVVIYSGDNK
jgi:hypothetical protein